MVVGYHHFRKPPYGVFMSFQWLSMRLCRRVGLVFSAGHPGRSPKEGVGKMGLGGWPPNLGTSLSAKGELEKSFANNWKVGETNLKISPELHEGSMCQHTCHVISYSCLFKYEEYESRQSKSLSRP